MTHLTQQSRRSESGFTLVELAIVMIIIGLLIGGILKGQELIANARVSSTVAQAKAVESGISGFRDKFDGMPGDLTAPAARVPNCTNWCNTVGDGDSFVETGNNTFDPGVASGNGASELTASLVQLGAAGFLGGVQGAANALGFTISNPTTPLGGGWQLGYSDGGTTAFTGLTLANTGNGGAAMSAGHYLTAVAGLNAAAGANNAPFEPVHAAAIDRKLDDGAPNSGSVRAIGGAAAANTCTNTVNAVIIYNEAVSGVLCGLAVKVQ